MPICHCSSAGLGDDIFDADWAWAADPAPGCSANPQDPSLPSASMPCATTQNHETQPGRGCTRSGLSISEPSALVHQHQLCGNSRVGQADAGTGRHPRQPRQSCRGINAPQPSTGVATCWQRPQQPSRAASTLQSPREHLHRAEPPQTQYLQDSFTLSERPPLAAINGNLLSPGTTTARQLQPCDSTEQKAVYGCSASCSKAFHKHGSKFQPSGFLARKEPAKSLRDALQQSAAAGNERAAAAVPTKPLRSIGDVLGKRRLEKTKISSAVTFDSKKGRVARITDFMPAPDPAPGPNHSHSRPEAQVISHHCVHLQPHAPWSSGGTPQ